VGFFFAYYFEMLKSIFGYLISSSA
jgi:hypothetical protein